MVNALPRELQRKILSYLDIDSRRALGVYCKLGAVPHVLQSRIISVPKIIRDTVDTYYVEPGIYFIEYTIYAKFIFFNIYTNKNSSKNFYGLHFVDEMCRR
jgi:hypothetical protein